MGGTGRGDEETRVRVAQDPLATIPTGLLHPTADLALPDRYEDLGRIGTGGMADVRRVRDRKLDAVMAMKITRWEVAGDPVTRERFLDEAKLTARLSHPSIPSVHDMGELADGRLWFTMQEIRGATLSEVIAALHAATTRSRWGEAEGFTFRRVVEAIARVAHAVAYAHSQDVVHRDLKPSNVMVGEFGEVVVMDWGLARYRRATDPPAPMRAYSPAEDGDRTGYGMMLGTPAYMPPEQAYGQLDRIGPPSDVYALGAMLYHLLAGKPPGMPKPGGPPPFPDSAPVDDALAALCVRAMAYHVEDRPQDASAVARALDEWLEGSLRRERALGVVQRARAMLPQVSQLDAEANALRERADAILSQTRPHTPVEEKLPGWRLEDQARQRHAEARRVELEALQTARAALDLAPDLPEAHALVAEYHRRQVEAAEARGDDDAAREHEVLLRAHDRGENARWLAGDGAVTLITEPPGATVHLFRFEERDRRRVEVPAGVLGTTPLVEIPLGRGSWMLRIRKPGYQEVAYPVYLRRLEHWDGVRPGDTAPTAIRLPKEGELGEDDCYVPAGWFISGDPSAPDGLPVRRLWVDGFLMKRHPVTNAEYIAFLNALIEAERAEEARRFAPTESFGVADRERPIWPRLPDGSFSLTGATDANGAPWKPRFPVTLIDDEAARAYCAWLPARAGAAWGLPNDLAWEKGARGVDGRRFPWGDEVDATWCRCAPSDPDRVARVAVDEYPLDLSPYGLGGMAGNSRDWCANEYRRSGLERDLPIVPPGEFEGAVRHRVVRGGSFFSSPDLCRAGGRFAAAPGSRSSGLGFRPCAPWPTAERPRRSGTAPRGST